MSPKKTLRQGFDTLSDLHNEAIHTLNITEIRLNTAESTLLGIIDAVRDISNRRQHWKPKRGKATTSAAKRAIRDQAEELITETAALSLQLAQATENLREAVKSLRSANCKD